MLQDDLFELIGGVEYSYDELMARLAEIFGVMKSSARNSFTALRRACPNAFSERIEGKKKFYFVSLPPK